MALSQIQCLDDNNVNPRTHESKPDFLYSEDQRLAVEVLLQDGREAFFKYLEARSLRGFLSDLELDTLAGSVEPYDPGLEIFPEDAEEDEPPLSLHYWPELSDTSIPMMDLGWPDSSSYRGVTRTTVYSQPPLEGQVHIKEVIRKMIAQAQKVIAVVMDVFTDVDIFRDLLDAGFKRKVSVYILLERTTLPHFLSMCRRANMHPGHLKQLRVRCTEGVQFHTRSTTIVRGRMGHRFMFVDGDKAVSGSYSFTWMSSRLEKNLVTVVTGQAVDAFDKLFRVLYGTSSLVDLRQVPTDPEPEPEPLPQPTSVALPSAALARKLYSPKYALALGNPSSTSSDSHNSPINTQSQENSGNPEVPDAKKGRQRRASKEAREEAHPIHPGLVDLEKAYLIEYLPIWPEPDPSSDIIGFINVRDNSKPIPVHLQRSEMFETSRAIRFSSPVNMPKETLPEVAKPRKLSAKPEEMNKLKPAQDKTKAGEKSMGDGGHPTQLNAQPGDIKSKAEATQQNSPLSGAPESDTAKTLKSEDKLHSNTPTNKDAGHYTTPHLNAPPQSSNKASAPNTGRPSHNTQAVTTNNPTPESQPGSKAKKEAETTLNKQKVIVSMTYTLESNSTQTSHLSRLAASKTRQHSPTESVLPHADSHTQAIHKQPQKSSEMTPNLQTPTVNSNVSPSSSTPPVPKPRTIQLVIKDGITSNGQKLPELSVIRRPETSTGPLVVQNEPAVEHKTSPEKKRKTVPELQNNSGKKTGAQKVADNTGNIREDAQQKQSWTSRETKNEKAVGLQDDSAGMQLVSGANLEALSDVLITDAPKAESVNIQEIIPKDVEPKTLTSVGCKLTPQLVCVATGQAGTKAPETAQTGCEFSEVPNKNSKNVTQCKAYRASVHEPQIISYCEMSPQDIGVLDNVDSLKSPKYTPVPEKSLRLLLSDTNMPDMRLPTPERESRSHAALVRTPTPEGLLPRSPTPDSRTHTPDPHSYTPDFRTPTPDGYVSARADSALSTTSEEYYECSDSPSREPVFDRAAHRNHGTTEDHVSVTHTNTPNATPAATGATYVNDHTCAATLGPTDRNTSSSETQSLPGPASLSSSSSLLEKKGEMGKEQEETANEENGREVDEKGSKLSVAEMRTEGDSQGAQRTGSKEATTTADHFSQRKDLTETVEKSLEAQPQVLKRKKVSNQSATGRSVDGRVTPGVSTNEGAEQKRWSTGDLKPKKIPSEGERPDKERAVDRGALGANGVEKRVRPQSAREADGQKILHTPPRPLRGQQQDRGASSPPQKSRSTLSLSAKQPSGSRPLGSRQLNQAESKALHSSLQVLDSTLSSRKPPARPAPPVAAGAVGSAAGRKQAEASHSQQSLLSQQPLSAQGRARAGQLPNQHLYQNPQASFLHTHSNTLSQPHPHSQNQTVSAQEAHGQEEGKSPFSVTFSRLYSLKGLKDRMSKKGSTSPPVQGRKSTS